MSVICPAVCGLPSSCYRDILVCVTSGLSREVDEKCTLLGCYAASSGASCWCVVCLHTALEYFSSLARRPLCRLRSCGIWRWVCDVSKQRNDFVSKNLDVRQECHIVSYSARHSGTQPLSQPASQPTSQSVKQPVVQSASQPVSHSNSQPLSQPVSPSVNPPYCRETWFAYDQVSVY